MALFLVLLYEAFHICQFNSYNDALVLFTCPLSLTYNEPCVLFTCPLSLSCNEAPVLFACPLYLMHV